MELALALLLTVVATDAPVIANPGFEDIREHSRWPDGSGELPQAWLFTHLPHQAHLVRYETLTDAGESSRSLAITVASDHPQQNVAYNIHQDVSGFVVGKSYRVSAKVRTQGLSTRPFLCVQCLDASKLKFVGFAGTPKRNLEADIAQWERIETTIRVPEETSAFRLRIGISSEGNAGGTAMIDDIEIVEVP